MCDRDDWGVHPRSVARAIESLGSAFEPSWLRSASAFELPGQPARAPHFAQQPFTELPRDRVDAGLRLMNSIGNCELYYFVRRRLKPTFVKLPTTSAPCEPQSTNLHDR